MEEYKKETLNSYARNPAFFEERWKEKMEKYALDDIEKFVAALQGPKVLDLGCGPGLYLEAFREKGLDAIGIDLSDEFLEICHSKGLNVRKMDMEQPLLYPYSYDGIWAHACLLHLPRSRAAAALATWAKLLKTHGVMHLAVKQGANEGFVPSERGDETKRWFTFFTDDELRGMLGKKFDVMHASSHENEDGAVWLKYLLKKKPDSKPLFQNA